MLLLLVVGGGLLFFGVGPSPFCAPRPCLKRHEKNNREMSSRTEVKESRYPSWKCSFEELETFP